MMEKKIKSNEILSKLHLKMPSTIQTEIKNIDWFVRGFIEQINILKITNYIKCFSKQSRFALA